MGFLRTPYEHLPLSERVRVDPLAIKNATGYLDICSECGSRYRRLSETRTICGVCFGSTPLVDAAKSAYRARAVTPGKV